MDALTKSPSSESATSRWQLSPKEKRVALILLAFALLGSALAGRIAVVTSESIDHRVFFLSKLAGPINKGDYLVFNKEGAHAFMQKSMKVHDRMIKKVGCVPGEALKVDETLNYTCDGDPLGQALTADSNGRPLTLFVFNGLVPARHYFMVGTHPRSYDSKYYGLINEHDFLYKALPIW